MKNIHIHTKTANLIIYCLLIISVFFLYGCYTPAAVPSGSPENIYVKDMVPEALSIIHAGLSDEDPMIRVNAIEVVSAGQRVKVMSKIRKLLRDNVVPVRFAAALAIGDMEYSLWKDDVEELLEDNDENVRIAAVYTLKKVGVSNDIEPIRKAIASNDQTICANAALLLGKCGGQSDLKLLYWALQHKDSSDKVRFQAVESIARLGDERIYPKIWTMLLSIYADDRVMGIRAMGALGTQKAREAMVTMLDDSVLEVRLAAAEQLGALGDMTGEPEVLAVFRKGLLGGSGVDTERGKVWTALAIGRIGTPSLARYLPEMLKDNSKSVRLAAAKAVIQCAGTGKKSERKK